MKTTNSGTRKCEKEAIPQSRSRSFLIIFTTTSGTNKTSGHPALEDVKDYLARASAALLASLGTQLNKMVGA